MSEYNYDHENTWRLEDEVEQLKEVYEYEQAQGKPRLFSFGVSYLDRSLLGIHEEDTVVIGAGSGVGKTELAISIAANATRDKTKVLLFALECKKGEVAKRLIYRRASNMYFDDLRSKAIKDPIQIDPQRYYLRLYDETFEKYVREAEKVILPSIETLKTIYRDERFTIEDFKGYFEQARATGVKLVVVDHLHYFDIDDAKNEHSETSRIIRKLRTLTVEHRIPVVLVSHIRKGASNGKVKRLVPHRDDLHGTSAIFKEAERVIMISQRAITGENGKMHHDKKHLSETFFHIAKNRPMSSVCPYVGCVIYNRITNTYEHRFALGEFSADGSEFEVIDEKDWPSYLD